MSRATVRDLVQVMASGWIPYSGAVDETLYKELGCPRPKDAMWFVQDGRYLCVSCRKRCARLDSARFQPLLPVSARRSPWRAAFAQLPMVSVEEFMRSRKGGGLRVDEAAWVLCISPRRVYDLIEEGALQRYGAIDPMRVTWDSVEQIRTS